MDIKEYLAQRKKEIDQTLDRYLPQKKSLLTQAMRYSVLNGGKRIRPILTMATTELVGGKKEDALLTACAVELIHAFTLIHDDLPCMDNDDYRRGKLTSHRVYGEAIAILTGDALLNYGFKLIIENCTINKLDPAITIRILEEICEAIGIEGVIGGQVEDILLENKKIDLPTLEEISRRKTVALICVSVKLGAILGRASKEEISLLTEYGRNIGFAFQIIDDILDVSEREKKGKEEKPSYPSLIGVEDSKKIAQEKISVAKSKLDRFGREAEILSAIADYVIQRKF